MLRSVGYATHNALYSRRPNAPTLGRELIPSPMLRVLIADDFEAVRKGVCAILSANLDIEVCGEAENGFEAVEKARALKPDLIVMDVSLPVLSGLDAAREIRKIFPTVPILILTMHESRFLVQERKGLV